MKALHKFFRISLVLGLFSLVSPVSEINAQGHVSFDVFYNELAPYGNWVYNNRYGQVWVPNVRRGFRPYATRGHWIMTDYGNTWVSDYDWGWAPFHYGRWYLDDFYGWAWVPGYDWGPAWVAWRSGGNHYGWAPLTPGLNVNISINIGRRIPRNYWSFVPQRHFMSPRLYDYCLPGRRVRNVYRQTTIINNTYVYNNQHHYYSGPQVREIERVTRQQVPVRRVRPAQRPGSPALRRGSVTMYQPRANGRRTAASRANSASYGPRRSERPANTQRSTYQRDSRSSAARSSNSRSYAAPNSRSRQGYSNNNRNSNGRGSEAQNYSRASERSSVNKRTQRSSTASQYSRSAAKPAARSRSSNTYSRSNDRSSAKSARTSSPKSRSSVSRSSSSRSSNPRSSVSRSSSTRSSSPNVSRSRTSRSTQRSEVSRSRSSSSRSSATRSSRKRPN